MIDRIRLSTLGWLWLVLPAIAFAPDRANAQAENAANASAKAGSVSELLAAHDQSLMRDLDVYIREHPGADDLEQAYLTLFETAIEHDWYAQADATAKSYLSKFPEGAVRPMARIVTTMAHAQANQFPEALEGFRALMQSLEGPEQQEFAVNFADSLAGSALAGGRHDVARMVYETVLEKYGESPELRVKVQDDLARIDMIGKPAPALALNDLSGRPFRLSDLKGKYVLIDFWATWCAPCLAELPNVQAAYAKYHDKGLEIVSISLDETPQAVSDFVKARKIPWRQIHNATSGGDAVAAYGISNIPSTFLVDPEGNVIRLELRGRNLSKTLEQLIK